MTNCEIIDMIANIIKNRVCINEKVDMDIVAVALNSTMGPILDIRHDLREASYAPAYNSIREISNSVLPKYTNGYNGLKVNTIDAALVMRTSSSGCYNYNNISSQVMSNIPSGSSTIINIVPYLVLSNIDEFVLSYTDLCRLYMNNAFFRIKQTEVPVTIRVEYNFNDVFTSFVYNNYSFGVNYNFGTNTFNISVSNPSMVTLKLTIERVNNDISVTINNKNYTGVCISKMSICPHTKKITWWEASTTNIASNKAVITSFIHSDHPKLPNILDLLNTYGSIDEVIIQDIVGKSSENNSVE